MKSWNWGGVGGGGLRVSFVSFEKNSLNMVNVHVIIFQNIGWKKSWLAPVDLEANCCLLWLQPETITVILSSGTLANNWSGSFGGTRIQLRGRCLTAMNPPLVLRFRIKRSTFSPPTFKLPLHKEGLLLNRLTPQLLSYLAPSHAFRLFLANQTPSLEVLIFSIRWCFRTSCLHLIHLPPKLVCLGNYYYPVVCDTCDWY